MLLAIYTIFILMSSMHFCEKCGKIMGVNKQMGLSMAICICGNYKQVSSDIVMKDKPSAKKDIGKGVLNANVNPEEKDEGFPHTCPKCNHEEADVKDLGAFISDESNIFLFKCRKCGYVYRQADGCSNM